MDCITHAVVEFVWEHSLAVVPVCWLTEDGSSYWPPYTVQEAIDNTVKQSEKPKSKWKKYPVRVMFQACKFTYIQ